MKVYRFLDAKFGLKTIAERRLRISPIMELNDPFEFLAVDLGDRIYRRKYQANKLSLAKNRGIISFSATWRNPLLWSHYSDKHRGICLCFEVPKNHLTKIIYKRERVLRIDNLTEDYIPKVLATKFKHWSYEKEYRAFFPLEGKIIIDGNYFAKFSDDIRLEQVFVGANSSVTRKDLKDALGTLSNKVNIVKTRAAFKSFEIVKNKNVNLWK